MNIWLFLCLDYVTLLLWWSRFQTFNDEMFKNISFLFTLVSAYMFVNLPVVLG